MQQPNAAYTMLDAYADVYRLDTRTKELLRKLVNTAFHEGKLEGMATMRNIYDETHNVQHQRGADAN